MSDWGNKVWHYHVHQRLGEVLFYYLARVRPFNIEEIKSRIHSLLIEKRLGSVRVFPIFGPYDLLIRAWLHPSIETEFRTWIDRALVNCRALYPFAVTYIDSRWYTRDINRDLLDSLTDDSIKAVQSGQDKHLLSQLISTNLVIEPNRLEEPTIKFFVAINFDDENQPIQVDVVRGITRFLLRSDYIKSPSIYRGFGFCSILVKGDATSYFDVANLPNWIGEEYASLGVSTETYLVHDQMHIVGDETIGDATFHAIQGRNLFVQWIIPEVYDKRSSEGYEIERFLLDVVHPSEAQSKSLTQRDKKLLHDYLHGYLESDPTRMAQTLFTFFFELENYLRNNLQEFIGRSGLSMKELYNEARIIKETNKFLSLGDLLNLYRLAIEHIKPNTQALMLKEDWQELARIRNKIAHGDVDFLKNWDEMLKGVLKQMSGIHELVSLVTTVTRNQYIGSY